MNWEKTVSLSQLKKDRRYLVDKGYMAILVVSINDDIFAIDNMCPHQGMPLIDGKIDPVKKTITCSWHHKCFEFSGDHLTFYKTKIEDGYVWVEFP